jgi:predicted GNAT superfamily acetyltransferase
MLAVRADLRGTGIGLALKRWQRTRLLDARVRRAQWTFDPLVAGNAHFNFARLGCTARVYLRDIYGTSDSPLHAGIGTDRLVVDWELDAPGVVALAAGKADGPASPDIRMAEIPLFEPAAAPAGPTVGIEVPADVQRLKAKDPEVARQWRWRTRAAFEAAFAAGYEARAFVRRPGGGGVYVLEATDAASGPPR